MPSTTSSTPVRSAPTTTMTSTSSSGVRVTYQPSATRATTPATTASRRQRRRRPWATTASRRAAILGSTDTAASRSSRWVVTVAARGRHRRSAPAARITASGYPTKRVSARRSTPEWASTPWRISAMSATTSSAEPPSSTWMKLACFGETSALPRRRPLSPAASMRRPAESSGGFVNTDPALAPPGWWALRHRTISASSASPSVVRAVGQPQLGGEHQVVHGQVRTAVAESEVDGGHPLILAVAEIEDVDPAQRRRHVGAVATGVHAYRTADGAGYADGPLETGQPGGDGPAGHDGKAGCGTGDHHGPLDLDAGELLTERHRETGEAGIGDEEVGPAADHQDRYALTRRPHDHIELDPIDVLDQQRCRASDAIGGEHPQRRIALRPRAQRLGHRGQQRSSRHHRHPRGLIRTPARGRPGDRARRRVRR